MIGKNLNQGVSILSEASPESIRVHLKNAISSEREATAELLSYLAKYECRGLHLRDGYSSIYGFLTLGHGYSEGAAARRSVVARFARSNPEILPMIAVGDLSLYVADLLARAVNKNEIATLKINDVLHSLNRRSKTEAERIIAGLGAITGNPVPRERVRAVSVKIPCQSPNPQPTLASGHGFPFDQVSLSYAGTRSAKRKSCQPRNPLRQRSRKIPIKR